MWRKSGEKSGMMIPVNVRTGEIAVNLAKNIPLEENAFPAMAFSADGRKLAVAIRDKGTALQIFDLAEVSEKPTLTRPITALDPQWAISPSVLAFSPDASKLALFFEHGDNALLLSWDVNKNEQTHEQVYPTSPAPGADPKKFTGSTLKWLGNEEWILYGMTLIPTSSSQFSYPLMFYQSSRSSRAKILFQYPIDPFNFEVVFETSDGRKLLAFVRLVNPNEPPEEPKPQEQP